MQQVITELKSAKIGTLSENEPMSDHTSWAIGGPVDIMIIPDGKRQLVEAVRMLQHYRIPWMTVGRGSNMLVSDKGIRGAVIKLGPALEYARFEEERVVAGGSHSFIKLSVLAGKAGLTGLEFAGGIPGTVGGAVYMNAGAHGSDVSRILKQAEVVLETGELVTMQTEDFKYAYRHSVLQEQAGIVMEAVFQLHYGDRKEIAAVMAKYKQRRLNTQPLQSACAGSVFRNPVPLFAAQLIEKAGLKGLQIGGAQVSTLHANFIVNTGKAKATDVLALMEQIQKTVKSQFDVELVPEVLVVGER